MDSVHLIILFLVIAGVAGALGATAMNALMRTIGSRGDTSINMVEALASYFTGSLDNAMRVGTIIHLSAGVFFGYVYTVIIMMTGVAGFVPVLFFALGIGFLHGLVVSYGLMFYVAERHPIERYRRATFEVGALHLVGHVVYGLVVGLIVALSPLTSAG